MGDLTPLKNKFKTLRLWYFCTHKHNPETVRLGGGVTMTVGVSWLISLHQNQSGWRKWISKNSLICGFVHRKPNHTFSSHDGYFLVDIFHLLIYHTSSNRVFECTQRQRCQWLFPCSILDPYFTLTPGLLICSDVTRVFLAVLPLSQSAHRSSHPSGCTPAR